MEHSILLSMMQLTQLGDLIDNDTVKHFGTGKFEAIRTYRKKNYWIQGGGAFKKILLK